MLKQHLCAALLVALCCLPASGRAATCRAAVAPGVIRSKGQVGGRYAWEFQYPVTLRLDGQQSGTPPQRFIFTLRLQRTDVQEKPAGLEVTQMISTHAS